MLIYDYASVGFHMDPQTTSVFIQILTRFDTTFATEIISYCSYLESARAHLLYSPSSNNTDLVLFSVIASQVNKKPSQVQVK